MFRVKANSVREYIDFDPRRSADLLKLDALIRKSAPGLVRYFHAGTPAGSPGMRMRMIGYGRFLYLATQGSEIEWPVLGVALQKNYISVYLSVTKEGQPILQAYRGALGELRSGNNNFSFRSFDELNAGVLAELLSEAAQMFARSGQNPVYYRQRSRR
jgi:hypothetical protein